MRLTHRTSSERLARRTGDARFAMAEQLSRRGRPGYRESSAASVSYDSVQTLAQPRERGAMRPLLLASLGTPPA
jgi:hypothetical protein